MKYLVMPNIFCIFVSKLKKEKNMSLIHSSLAEGLKKVGFNEKTSQAYYVSEQGRAIFSGPYESIEKSVEENGCGYLLPTVTYEEAITWLHEKKGIMIVVSPYTNKNKENTEGNVLYKYDIYLVNRKVIPLESKKTGETLLSMAQDIAIFNALKYATCVGEHFLKIDMNCLDNTFPNFVWWTNRAEICGINFETKQFIAIEDGACVTVDGKWLVHGYQLTEIPSDWKKLKYEVSDNKIIEKWYNLTYAN